MIVGGGGGALPAGIEATPLRGLCHHLHHGILLDVATVPDHAQRGNVECHIEEIRLEDTNSAFDPLRSGAALVGRW